MNAVGCAALFAGAGLHVFLGTMSGIVASTEVFGRMSTSRNLATPTCGSTAPWVLMKPTANGTGAALQSSAITIQRTAKIAHRKVERIEMF